MQRIFVDIRDEYIKKYFNNRDLVSVNELLTKIEDLIGDVERLEEELEDTKKDMEDNYIPRKNGDIDMYGC